MSTEQLVAGVQALLQATTKAELVQAAQDYPILLTERAEVFIADGNAQLRAKGQADSATRIEEQYQTLCQLGQADPTIETPLTAIDLKKKTLTTGAAWKSAPVHIQDQFLKDYINTHQQALEEYTYESNPEIWADIQVKIANYYMWLLDLRDEDHFSQKNNYNKAIEHLKLSLKVYTSKGQGLIHKQIAGVYLNSCTIEPDKADENFNKALEHYELALQEITQVNAPDEWAKIKATIGRIYLDIIHLDYNKNIESSIDHNQQALQVYKLETHPIQFAKVLSILGNAYQDRVIENRAQNIEQGIEYLRQAFNIFMNRNMIEEASDLVNDLGTAYAKRLVGNPNDNAKKAISLFKKALDFSSEKDMPYWARIQTNLANLYIEQHTPGNRADNLEEAILHYQKALDATYSDDTYLIERATAENNLGTTYRKRIQGKRLDNLEIAITHLEKAKKIREKLNLKHDLAQTQMNLGNVYNERIKGERYDNIEKAIDYYQQAFKNISKKHLPYYWANIQLNLGNAYLLRIAGNRIANLNMAIEYFNQGLTYFEEKKFPGRWADIHRNLSYAYIQYNEGERKQHLENAINHSKKSLNVRTKGKYPIEWAEVQSNLGNIYIDPEKSGNQQENLKQAIEYYESACRVFLREKHLVRWAEIRSNLANLYGILYPLDNNHIKTAIKAYQDALGVFKPNIFPYKCRQVASLLSQTYFTQQMWAEVVELYPTIERANKTILNSAYTELGRQHEVGQFIKTYAQTCYALLQLGQYGEALAVLEQGKTRLLNETLALDEVDLTLLPAEQQQSIQTQRQTVRDLEMTLRLMDNNQKLTGLGALPDGWAGHHRPIADQLAKEREKLRQFIDSIRQEYPNFMPSGFDLSDLLALIPKGGALVAPVVTLQGSVVFVIPYGVELELLDDHILWLDDFTTEKLEAMLIGSEDKPGWVRIYIDRQKDREARNTWLNMLDSTTQQLWKYLMGPLHERLQLLEGVSKDQPAPVFLMPQGGLGLLPLHAAWTNENVSKGFQRSFESATRHYFIDNYIVNYVPSGYVLSISQQRIDEANRQHQRLMAVVNPTGDLGFASMESLAIAKLFESPDLLINNQATKHAVKKLATGQTYLHFACHGYYNWLQPMQSGLELADETILTLADIISHMDLSSNRLVTLSACETGISEFRDSPDEFIGLPTGFLQAGTPGVLGTLWAVQDQATGLLLQWFYHYHLKDGQSPSEALRQAQIWLRDTDNEAIITYLSEMTYLPKDVVEPLIWRLEDMQNEKAYQHPYYWAAFSYTGL